MFSEEKVTHMASYLLIKRGGRMSYMKLLKLLYLAERESLVKWGETMSGDKFVSMPHGPVMSSTYDLLQNRNTVWNAFINSEANCEVSIKDSVVEDDLDELSVAEIKILDSIFEQFGAMGRWEIRDYTHNHCKEWQDPDGSSFPIDPVNILLAKGVSKTEASVLLQHGAEQTYLKNLKQVLA
ncbi:MAG: DUF4065 domain-containing protein [Methyloprofundus sp.]|nr:DUF4065 domain-containing protein [Methyloprofundus sp.]